MMTNEAILIIVGGIFILVGAIAMILNKFPSPVKIAGTELPINNDTRKVFMNFGAFFIVLGVIFLLLGAYKVLFPSTLPQTSESASTSSLTPSTLISPIAMPPSTETLLPPSAGDPADIVITEVMADPCGTGEDEKTDEYIELYNKGTTAVDVNGWWITTSGGGNGTPDQLVAWDIRNAGISFGSDIITNSTVIKPNQYAIILASTYNNGSHPYTFLPKTIILTVAESTRIGNEENGILGTYEPLDAILLYYGTSTNIDQGYSSYGKPAYGSGSSPESVKANVGGDIPLKLDACNSAERITPDLDDAPGNWVKKENGSPGSGY